MRAVFVVVADIFRKERFQMAFVPCNDVVQQVAPTTLNPSLCDAILPRTFKGGSERDDRQRSNDCGNLGSILAITVEDEKPGSCCKRKRFPQLLDHPLARRMLGDVDVQDTPTIMTDHEKAVQHAERDRRSREKIKRRDGFPMIAQKGEPTLGSLRISRRSFHPTRDRSLGNIETEHKKLAMNARRSPRRILSHHAEDQIPNFLRSLSSPDWPSYFRNQLPIQPEASAVPPDHRLRRHDNESLFPSGPEPSRQNPEKLVGHRQSRLWMFSFQRRELLAKSQVFQ